MPVLLFLVTQACKTGIKSKEGGIKYCKERKITSPPNEIKSS